MNVLVHYQYRDAANWKESKRVVFSNVDGVNVGLVEKALLASLYDDTFFVAESVSLPTCYLDKDSDPDAHGWHELLGVIETDEPPSDKLGRTIADLAVEFTRCNLKGWEPVRDIAQSVS